MTQKLNDMHGANLSHQALVHQSVKYRHVDDVAGGHDGRAYVLIERGNIFRV